MDILFVCLGGDTVLWHACFSGSNMGKETYFSGSGCSRTPRWCPWGQWRPRKLPRRCRWSPPPGAILRRATKRNVIPQSDGTNISTVWGTRRNIHNSAHSCNEEATVLFQAHACTDSPHLPLSFLSLQQTRTEGRFAIFYPSKWFWQYPSGTRPCNKNTQAQYHRKKQLCAVRPNNSKYRRKLITKP